MLLTGLFLLGFNAFAGVRQNQFCAVARLNRGQDFRVANRDSLRPPIFTNVAHTA